MKVNEIASQASNFKIEKNLKDIVLCSFNDLLLINN